MDQSAIPVRYAKALFELSIEQKLEEAIYRDIILVKQIISDNTNFRLLLMSRAITQAEKNELVKNIIEPHVNKLTYKFLNYVIKKRREEFITRIVLEYISCYNQKNNIIQVTVKSASTLSNQHIDKIKNIISTQTNKTPVLSNITDSSLIGGYQVFVNDRFYDISVKGMLKKIEQSL